MAIPVVVINMEKSVDRLKKITENINNIGLQFTRFSAIDGSQLTEQEIVDNTTFMCRKLLCSRSVIGCALSHITVWRNFLDNQYGSSDILCVMEDDIEISSDFPNFLNDAEYIQEQLNFDMIRVNCGKTNINMKKVKVGRYTFIENPILPLSMACYLITRQGARKALEILKNRVSYHIDFSLALGMLSHQMAYYILADPELITLSLTKPSTICKNDTKGLIMPLIKNSDVKWYLNIPVASIDTRYNISLYTAILLILLIIGLYRKWTIFTVIVLVELVLVNLK